MKPGDLVKDKHTDDLALILSFKELDFGEESDQYPVFVWLDTFEVDSCFVDRLELVSEGQYPCP